MADPTGQARPSRLQALLSVIGGGLMIAAFFVPAQLGYTTAGVTTNGPVTLLTLWDGVLRAGRFTRIWDSRTYTYVTYPPQIFTALIAAVPLLMGVLIAALGVWSLLRGPGDTRRGFVMSAVVLAFFTSLDRLVVDGFSVGAYPAGVQALSDLWLDRLGYFTLTLGLFLVMASAFSSLARRGD